MKNEIYNPKEVRTLKELRYEKARVTIEMAYLEENIQAKINHFMHGGFLDAMGIGAGMFASLEKWKVYFEYVTKGWHWIKNFIHKRKGSNNVQHT